MCQNGGVCTERYNDKAQCICVAGYTGPDCSSREQSSGLTPTQIAIITVAVVLAAIVLFLFLMIFILCKRVKINENMVSFKGYRICSRCEVWRINFNRSVCGNIRWAKWQCCQRSTIAPTIKMNHLRHTNHGMSLIWKFLVLNRVKQTAPRPPQQGKITRYENDE